MPLQGGASIAHAVVVVVCLCLVHSCGSQMEGMPKKEKVLHNKADLKYIGCAVCEEVVKTVHRTVNDMRKALPDGKKLKEIDIIEKLETVCNPEEEAGLWTSHFDLVADGGFLTLKDMGARGKCKVECQTIARACDNLLGEHDTDVAEELYKGTLQRAQLNQLLCYDLSSACGAKAPKLPKAGRPHDEEWEELSEDEAKVLDMMREMKGEGMPGMSMYSRDEIMQQMEQYQGMYSEGYEDYSDSPDQGEEEPHPEGAFGDNVSPGAILKETIDTVKDTVGSAVDGAKKAASKLAGMFSGKSSSSTEL